MTLTLLQISISVALVGYLGIWYRQQARRRANSWDGIVSRLRANDWGIEEISERYLYKGSVQVTSRDVWERIQGCKGLWAMYKNCPVLIQLADYAAEHGENVDREMLEGLRSDAIQIRLHVMLALGQYICSASSIAASVNAHRAVTTYSSMMVQLTCFVQEYSTGLFPRYLDAVS